MKKSEKYLLILPLLIISIAYVSAMACDLSVSMINQDPYPAIPGDYVKLVFQVDGVDNPLCKKIYFDLVEQYPISFDPGQDHEILIDSVDYKNSFKSSLIASFKVRLDIDSLDGDNPLEVKYRYANNLNYETKEFNLYVQNNEANFEIYVKEYNPETKQIILEILNVGKDDLKALAVEIQKQDNIEIKGPKTNIIGDLDSNEYTTANFEATPKQGEIRVIIHYTDTVGERRNVEEGVYYDPSYFENRAAAKKKMPTSTILLIIIIIAVIIYFIYKRIKKKRQHKKIHRG